MGSPTQNNNWLCKTHDKEYEYYCHNCKKYTCPMCSKNISSPHHWERIYKVVKRKRFVFPKRSAEIRDKHVPKIKKSLQDMHKVKARFERANSEKIQMLKVMKESAMSAIGAVFDHYIISLQHKLTANRQKLDNIANQLKNLTEDLEQLAEMMEKQAGTFSSLFTSDFEVLETEREAEQKIDQARLLTLHPFTNRWKSTTELNLQELNRNVEKVASSIILPQDPSKLHTTEIANFCLEKDAAMNMSATSTRQIWCKTQKSNCLELYSHEGKKLNTVTVMCNYVVAIDDKTMVVTNSAMKKINTVNQDGEVVLLKNTTPLYPTFIGRSLDGGILVSLIDQPNFDRQDYSKRVVQHITLNGSIKKTYHYEEDNRTPLFTYPESVTQNTNTDICVINFTSESNGYLCVLHASGKVHFTYKGQSDSESLFFPSDVCCDSRCNIMVSDSVNRSIHLLNSTGQFIKYIISKTNIAPICMSIINDHLWIGCEKGQIKLLSIKH